MCIVRHMLSFYHVLLCLFFAHAAERQTSAFHTDKVDNKIFFYPTQTKICNGRSEKNILRSLACV